MLMTTASVWFLDIVGSVEDVVYEDDRGDGEGEGGGVLQEGERAGAARTTSQ